MPFDGITFQQVATNGINYRLADTGGTGPLVLMLHGFPESWYSWRHQLPALAAAGYRAVAADMRGYGGSDKPHEVTAYDQVTLSDDVIGIVDALGYEQAVIVGHDWGAPVTWNMALRFPERVPAIAVMSVPYRPRGAYPPLAILKKMFEDRFFYMLYFQTPGVAEAELEADVENFLRIFYHGASGDADRGAFVPEKKKGEKLLTGMKAPDSLPDWFTREDLDYYTAEFTRGGFRGPLNWYRNMDRSWERLADFQDAPVTQPTLFIAGEKDPVLNFTPDSLNVMKQNVPDLKELLLLPGCGHWTQQERPEAVNEALLKFLKSL